jgi:uncharacterized protein YyaL (SSP411 family)
LEDYAFFLDGLLELYEADFDPRWLAQARTLASQMIERFWDEPGGGFFLRGRDEPPLIVQSKEVYDGATPSGNSMAAWALLRLGRLTANARFEEIGRRAIDAFAQALQRAPFGSPQMFIALDFAAGPTKEVVIAGDPTAPGTQAMIRATRERFLPRALTLLHPDGPAGTGLEALAPYVKPQRAIDGQPTAYVCENFICKLPTTDVARFIQLLEQ